MVLFKELINFPVSPPFCKPGDLLSVRTDNGPPWKEGAILSMARKRGHDGRAAHGTGNTIHVRITLDKPMFVVLSERNITAFINLLHIESGVIVSVYDWWIERNFCHENITK